MALRTAHPGLQWTFGALKMLPYHGQTVSTGGTCQETTTIVLCSLQLATSGVCQHWVPMILFSKVYKEQRGEEDAALPGRSNLPHVTVIQCCLQWLLQNWCFAQMSCFSLKWVIDLLYQKWWCALFQGKKCPYSMYKYVDLTKGKITRLLTACLSRSKNTQIYLRVRGRWETNHWKF